MSHSSKTLKNLRHQDAARHRSTNSVGRSLEKSLFGAELIRSINDIQSEYNARLQRTNIDQADGLRKFQWNYWKQKVTQMHLENAKVYVHIHESPDDYVRGALELCWNKITEFYLMLNLMNRDLRADLVANDAEESERTMLISIEAIQKFRCRSHLKEWRVNKMQTESNDSIDDETNSIDTIGDSDTDDIFYEKIRDSLIKRANHFD